VPGTQIVGCRDPGKTGANHENPDVIA
jgi:hypothetical protein